jgi:hypothetical protein
MASLLNNKDNTDNLNKGNTGNLNMGHLLSSTDSLRVNTDSLLSSTANLSNSTDSLNNKDSTASLNLLRDNTDSLRVGWGIRG